jgi:hypothetical protein
LQEEFCGNGNFFQSLQIQANEGTIDRPMGKNSVSNGQLAPYASSNLTIPTP